MDVIYCLRCHNKKRGLDYEKAKSQIAEKLNISVNDVNDGCPSFCGPGAINNFVEVDGELIVASTFDELLEKLSNL